MERQERITLAQVRHFCWSAKNGAMKSIDRALAAKTSIEYDDEIERAAKFAKDFETWNKVLRSLDK